MNYLNRIVGIGLFACVFILTSFIISEELSTTIIVVDGKALLVDVDKDGEIVTTYMEVPEYLTSTKHHELKVEEAKESYIRLSKLQMDQIRFISILDSEESYTDTMSDNLSDLADHYQQTYANEIIITIAKNPSNTDVISHNLTMLRSELIQKGVSESDISVDYKIDLGEEPTPFIKVSAGFRKLSSL